MTVKLCNFADIDKVAEEHGKFDFVLADLGVSSMQIDNPERGFTYKFDGPLDLRMNPQKGESAAQRLKSMDAEEIEGMLVENSDEPYAAEITEVLMNWRKTREISGNYNRIKRSNRRSSDISSGEREKRGSQEIMSENIPGNSHRREPGNLKCYMHS